MYWFAAQQQTSTYRLQDFRSLYWKFSVEEMILLHWKCLENWKNQTMLEKHKYIHSSFSVEEKELTPSFQDPLEVAWALQRPNIAWKM